mgnify:CR=1 FL=1
MKKRINQKGFGAIEVLLLLILLVLLTFTGWYVWNHNKSGDDTKNTSAKSTATNNNSDTDSSTRLYSNNDIGLKFRYPKTWGEANTGPSPESHHLLKGSEYEITFSNNEYIQVGVSSEDREHDAGMGHGGMVYAGAYAYRQALNDEYLQNPVYATVHEKNDKLLLSSAAFSGVGCVGAGSILVHSLSGNATYPVVAFLYIDTLGDDDESICEGDQYKKHISTKHVNELKALSKTIESM